MQPTRLGSVVTTQTLSLSGKARLLAEYFVGRRSDAGDESLESFVTRRLGKEAYENLVEPIVSGIFTADPQTLSMQATMPQFLDMERKHGGLIRGYLAAKRKDAAAVARRASGARYDQFMAPRDGMSSWISHMQSQLPDGAVRLGESVKELHAHRSEGGSTWRVVTEHAAVDADAVVLATPANATARLLQHVAPQAASLVQSVDYASSAVVAMIVERQELSGRIDGFGSIVPRKEGRAALAISYTSNKYPGRVPDGEILLRVFLGGALSPETVDLLDDELESIAAREVKDILGWSGRGLNWQGVIRWKNAMPQYRIGHVERMDEVDQLLAAQPTIALCGAAYRGVGIPQCVRGAKQAAENIIAALRQGEIS